MMTFLYYSILEHFLSFLWITCYLRYYIQHSIKGYTHLVQKYIENLGHPVQMFIIYESIDY